MTEEMKLLISFITASGFVVANQNGEWSVTKRPKGQRVVKQAEYTSEFEQAWKLYPRRAGTNPKDKAFQQWNLRLKEGELVNDLIHGTIRYADCLRKTGKEGGEYVLQAQTFYGPSKHYHGEFKVAQSVVLKLPAGNDELLRFARENKLPEANMNESWQQYRQRLTEILEKRSKA